MASVGGAELLPPARLRLEEETRGAADGAPTLVSDLALDLAGEALYSVLAYRVFV